MKTLYSCVAAIFVISAVASQAKAEPCQLSDECDAGEFCVNLECAVPNAKISECGDSLDCDHMFTCISGICKPDGVYCETVTGWEVIWATGSSLTCMDGMGTGSASTSVGTDMDCSGECDPATSVDLPNIEVADLQEQCLTEVEHTCGSEIPVPQEVCAPDALKICTDWLMLAAEIAANCEDEFSNSTSGNEETPIGDGGDMGWETDTDMVVEEDMGGGASGKGTAVAGIISMRGLESTVSPWALVDCCDGLADEDAAVITGFVDCINETSTSDCDAIWACYEENSENLDNIFGGYETEKGMDGGEANGDVDNTSAPRDEDVVVAGDGQAADDADGATDGGSSDSGCTFVSPGALGTSLLSILL
ncbi:MAG: hypothetical protein JXX14_24670 [Deltaproteobacteria bacterium]|nr:hypothetical protein [Deltaproteobacteria bacterium]